MSKRKVLSVLAAAMSMSMLAAACGGGSDSGTDGGGGNTALTGTITISGSSTVEPISSLVAEKFAGANPATERQS